MAPTDPVTLAADRLERAARAVAEGMASVAAAHPQDELALIRAATAVQIVENATMRAQLVPREMAEAMTREAAEASEEVSDRVADGLQTVEGGLSQLDRVAARVALQFAQHRIMAWEGATEQLRELMPVEDNDGA